MAYRAFPLFFTAWMLFTSSWLFADTEGIHSDSSASDAVSQAPANEAGTNHTEPSKHPEGENRQELRKLGKNSFGPEVEIDIGGGKKARFQATFLKGTKNCSLISVAHGFDDLIGTASPDSVKVKTADFEEFEVKIKRFPKYEAGEKKNKAAASTATESQPAAPANASPESAPNAQAGTSPPSGGEKSGGIAPPGDVALLTAPSSLCEALKKKQEADGREYEFNVCDSRPQKGQRVFMTSANKGRMVAGDATGEKVESIKAFTVKMDGKDIKQGDSGAGLVKQGKRKKCITGIQALANPAGKDEKGYMDEVSLTDLAETEIKQ